MAEWFADQAALAAVVAAVVAFARENIFKTLQGLGVIALSLGIGAAMGVAGHLLGYVTGGLGSAVVFGVSAGFLASGGFDFLRGVLGGKAQPEA